MTRPRVLFVSPYASVGGGAERVLLDHARLLDRSRFEPLAAVLAPGTMAEAFNGLGLRTYVSESHSESKPWGMLRELRRFGDFVRQSGVDVIVGNKHRSILYWSLTAARRAGFIWLLYDPLPDQGAVRHLVSRVIDCWHPSWTVWGTPEASATYLRRFPRLGGSNSSSIFPGTNPEALSFDADAERARVRWNLPAGAPVFSVFARMQPSKGQLQLVEAIPAVLAEFPEARFLICGGRVGGMPSDHERAVHAAVAEGRLEGRVLLTGIVTEQEKRDILALSTAVVHPALWEPFGISVIEGMAVGKPVVVADAQGPSAIVEHEVTGLVVPKDRPAALADAIRRLLREPERAREMGSRAAARVVERYHERVATRRLEDAITAVLARAPRG